MPFICTIHHRRIIVRWINSCAVAKYRIRCIQFLSKPLEDNDKWPDPRRIVEAQSASRQMTEYGSKYPYPNSRRRIRSRPRLHDKKYGNSIEVDKLSKVVGCAFDSMTMPKKMAKKSSTVRRCTMYHRVMQHDPKSADLKKRQSSESQTTDYAAHYRCSFDPSIESFERQQR